MIHRARHLSAELPLAYQSELTFRLVGRSRLVEKEIIRRRVIGPARVRMGVVVSTAFPFSQLPTIRS